MPGLTAEEIGPLMLLRRSDLDAGAARFRAGIVVQVATLRIMIDAGICTADAACAMVRNVQADYPALFQTEEVSRSVQWAVDMLQGETPLHGSQIEKMMQKKARENSK